MRRHILLTLVVLTSTAATAIGQPGIGSPAPQPQGRKTWRLIPPNPLEPLGTDAGLPLAYVTAIAQSPRGFLWFGTQSGGVARFDGYEMRVLNRDPQSPVELPSTFIKALAFDADGRLWIGTGDAGVAIYDPDTDAVVAHLVHDDADERSLRSNGVTALLRDPQGNMWVATAGGTLSRFDASGKSDSVLVSDTDAEIHALAVGSHGRIWVGGEHGLASLDDQSMRVTARVRHGDGRNQLSGDEVRAVLEDERGGLWVGTNAGLDHQRPGEPTFVRFRHSVTDLNTLSDDRINVILADASGKLWIGSENGLNEIDPKTGAVTRYARDPDNLFASGGYPVFVTAAFQDRSGVLWFGAQSGLSKLSPLRRVFHTYQYYSVGGDPVSFVDGEDGVLWAGTYSGGLQKIDRENNTVTIYPHLVSQASGDRIALTQWITALYLDRRGVLWLGGQELGLVAFDTKTEKHTHYPSRPEELSGPTAARIETILPAGRGRLWLATWGGGLNLFDPATGEFSDYIADEGNPATLSSDYLYTMRFDRSDRAILWIGTARGGLCRFDTRTLTAQRISLAPSGGDALRYDTVLTIHQDDDGALWLGTDGGGLVRYDPRTATLTHYSRDDGLPDNTIYGILDDKLGRLWLSTNGGGLVAFDPDGPSFTAYTKADGLVANEFIQNAYYKSATGELFFSGGGGAQDIGFTVFHPELVRDDRATPPLVVTDLQIFNRAAQLDRPIWTLPRIYLGYTQSVFSLEFAALSYAQTRGIRYAYRMDGLHDWIETERRFVTYTNLDGGEYVFRVRASNRHGEWGEDEIALKIEVAPRPWRTWWAYVLYLLLGISVVLGYLIYQARKVERLRRAHHLETIERDLKLTGAVQEGFLPQSSGLREPAFDLFGFYRPAGAASGDWWWYERSGSKLLILTGDVTGHGPGPAMVTAAVATTFRMVASPELSPSRRSLSLEQRLEMCHRAVLQVSNGEYSVTMSAVELDLATGQLTFYSAGGLPVMLHAPNRRVRMLACPGTPLGGHRRLALGKARTTLHPGERLLLQTDGIVETQMRNGRMIGMRRLAYAFSDTDSDVAVAAQRLVTFADTLRGDTPQSDDWTLAIACWRGPV